MYEELDYTFKTLFEFICHGNFMRENEDEAWDFLEDLLWKTMYLDSPSENPNTSTSTNKGMIYSVETSIAIEDKIVALKGKTEALETLSALYISQINEVQTLTYFNCGTPNHVIKECPLLLNLMHLIPKQANALYPRPMNKSYTPIYNPSWRNYPNHSWS